MNSGVEISKRLILINSASTVVLRVISLTVLLWLNTWLVNKVSKDEFALFSVIFQLLIFIPLLTGAIATALGRFVVVAYAQRDERGVSELTSTMFPACVAGAGLILLIGAPMAFYIDSLIDIVDDPNSPDRGRLVREAGIMFGILIGSAVVRIWSLPFRMGIHIKQRFVLANIIGLGCELLRIVTLLGLIFLVDTRALWVVVAGVPSTILEVWITTVISRRLVPALRFQRRSFRADLFKPVLSYGWWSLMIRLAVQLRETLTLLLLRNNMASIQAGTFGFAARFDSQIRQNALIMVPTLQPALTAMYATGQVDRLRRTYFRFGRYLLWAFMFAGLPLIVFRSEFWHLYLGAAQHEEYPDVEVVLALLCARMVTIFAQGPIMAISFAHGESKPVARRVIVVESVTCVLLLYLVLVEGTGAVGLAVAIAAVQMIGHPLLMWPLGLRLSGASWSEWLRATVWLGLLPGLCATPVWCGLRVWSPPETLIALLAQGAVGAAVYAGAIFVFCLQSNERADLAKVVARCRGVFRLGK